VRGLTLSEIETHHPATFRSRGVAVAFTTPRLAGARVRQSRHSGIELVVPNPSGGRGFYILQWPGVRALCHPTVHDTVLFQRCSHVAAIDPAGIRGAAQDVAVEGHAGRDAMAAAEAAIANDRAQRLAAHVRLATRLLQQTEPNPPEAGRATERTPNLDRRVGAVLRQLAPSFGQQAGHLAGCLAAMGDAFAATGVARDDRNGRVAHLIAGLDATASSLVGWLEHDPGNEIGGLCHAVARAMRTATRSAEAVLRITHAATSDPAALLRRWVTDADDVRAVASRCDWLLDGWERVCLLWATAQSVASRRAALLEMAPLVPVLPREVQAWTDVAIPSEAMDQTCRVTCCDDSWRSGGAAFALIERNERLRAMSA
jgi:hypothetical protein